MKAHPQFKTIPVKDKTQNVHDLRIALSKAEKLKKQLLEQYQSELDTYLEDLKEREKKRLRQEELQRYFN